MESQNEMYMRGLRDGFLGSFPQALMNPYASSYGYYPTPPVPPFFGFPQFPTMTFNPYAPTPPYAPTLPYAPTPFTASMTNPTPVPNPMFFTPPLNPAMNPPNPYQWPMETKSTQSTAFSQPFPANPSQVTSTVETPQGTSISQPQISSTSGSAKPASPTHPSFTFMPYTSSSQTPFTASSVSHSTPLPNPISFASAVTQESNPLQTTRPIETKTPQPSLSLLALSSTSDSVAPKPSCASSPVSGFLMETLALPPSTKDTDQNEKEERVDAMLLSVPEEEALDAQPAEINEEEKRVDAMILSGPEEAFETPLQILPLSPTPSESLGKSSDLKEEALLNLMVSDEESTPSISSKISRPDEFKTRPIPFKKRRKSKFNVMAGPDGKFYCLFCKTLGIQSKPYISTQTLGRHVRAKHQEKPDTPDRNATPSISSKISRPDEFKTKTIKPRRERKSKFNIIKGADGKYHCLFCKTVEDKVKSYDDPRSLRRHIKKIHPDQVS